MAQQDEDAFFTNSLGHKIYCKCWYPRLRAKAPKALVFVCHGFAEHYGWYEDLADVLTNRGILVFAHDHVGHGRSGGSPAYVGTFQTYIDDVFTHCDKMKDLYPDIPLFIFGHSMGGCISLLTSIQRPGYFTGMVQEAPAVVIHPDSAQWWKIWAARILGWVVPWLALPVFIDLDYCSKDPQIVQLMRDDPLNYKGGLKVGWGLAFLNALSELQSRLNEVTLPLLIVHGDDDRLTDIAGSNLLNEMSPSKDKTYSVYEGAYHQLRNEPDGVGERAKREIVDWLVKRAK